MTQRPPDQPSLSSPAAAALLQDTTPWLSCDECFERMDVYCESVVQQSTTPDEAMATHLRACAACHEEAQSLIDLLKAV
jgi:cytochrome c553